MENSYKVLDCHMVVGFQLRKNASNLKRLTMIKIRILLRITLNHSREDFCGVTGFFMVSHLYYYLYLY